MVLRIHDIQSSVCARTHAFLGMIPPGCYDLDIPKGKMKLCEVMCSWSLSWEAEKSGLKPDKSLDTSCNDTVNALLFLSCVCISSLNVPLTLGSVLHPAQHQSDSSDPAVLG